MGGSESGLASQQSRIVCGASYRRTAELKEEKIEVKYIEYAYFINNWQKKNLPEIFEERGKK
jgi:hypothetical protein